MSDADVVQIGSGGRLYKDARDQDKDKESKAKAPTLAQRRKDAAEARRNVRVKLGLDKPPVDEGLPSGADRPEEPKPAPQQPAWGTVGVRNPPQPEPPKTPVDWTGISSTGLEIAGIGAISFGFWMYSAWLGVVVLGLCLILMGIAIGLPPGRPGARRRTAQTRRQR